MTTVSTHRAADRRVNRRGGDRVIRYDRFRHGPRCTRWSSGCRYYYGGYYYRTPWWTLPLIGTGIVIGSTFGQPVYRSGTLSRRHVEWCRDRYRSYNARTNTWVAYSGRVHQCRSPYWP